MLHSRSPGKMGRSIVKKKITLDKKVIIEELGICGHTLEMEGREECYVEIKGKNYKLIGYPCCIREKIKELQK